ncbi:MAG: carbamoyltransferase [Deltaproteobacteria bacterium]|nr:carbamoyltransferase [Deltaproteobacteria bacterium]
MKDGSTILGVSAFFHDAAAAVVRDGKVVAAAQEERFTRIKGDPSFPEKAITACMETAGLTLKDLDMVVFHEKPWLHFERLIETAIAVAPKGLPLFLRAMPVWLRERLFLHRLFKRKLGTDLPLEYAGHHESHMAAAFYPSPFETAAILTVDGVGEWSTTSLGVGRGAKIDLLSEMRFPHSLGLLYSAFTAYLGFRVNFGEYKVMGLAPYGEPAYVDAIKNTIVEMRNDGSFRLNMRYFDYTHAMRTTNPRFWALFGGKPRRPEGPLNQRHMDVARSIQQVCEDILLGLARHAHERTGERKLVLAGGVALNCVANGRILREGPFDDMWVQPASGDAGSAIGAALAVWHGHLGHSRKRPSGDLMQGALLGPEHGHDEVTGTLAGFGAKWHEFDEVGIADEVARRVAAGQVVGHLSGRMEFGPRALGNRSILGDPRLPGMQRRMNLKIKFRESFRPFAPAVLAERANDWFDLDGASPYMLLVSLVQQAHRLPIDNDDAYKKGLALLDVRRSDIPAVTHVDWSARVQTVDAGTNPRFHAILAAFERLTGCPVMINTSFNVRGEPIVATPQDAFRCFQQTDMDALVLNNCVVDRTEQPKELIERDWSREFEQD